MCFEQTNISGLAHQQAWTPCQCLDGGRKNNQTYPMAGLILDSHVDTPKLKVLEGWISGQATWACRAYRIPDTDALDRDPEIWIAADWIYAFDCLTGLESSSTLNETIARMGAKIMPFRVCLCGFCSLIRYFLCKQTHQLRSFALFRGFWCFRATSWTSKWDLRKGNATDQAKLRNWRRPMSFTQSLAVLDRFNRLGGWSNQNPHDQQACLFATFRH